MKQLLLIILIGIALVSCKKEEKEEVIPPHVEETIEVTIKSLSPYVRVDVSQLGYMHSESMYSTDGKFEHTYTVSKERELKVGIINSAEDDEYVRWNTWIYAGDELVLTDYGQEYQDAYNTYYITF